MQIEVWLVPLQQPVQPAPQLPPLPPPAPAQAKSTHARVPQLAQATPPLPQVATRALLGLFRQLPSEAQQPAQFAGPHAAEWSVDPHEGPTASNKPTVRPKRRGGRR